MRSLSSTSAISPHHDFTNQQPMSYQYNHTISPDSGIPQTTCLSHYVIVQPFAHIHSPLPCHPISLPFCNTNSFLLPPKPVLCTPLIIIYQLGWESNPPLGSRAPTDFHRSQLLTVPFMKFPLWLQPIHKLSRFPCQRIIPGQTDKVLKQNLVNPTILHARDLALLPPILFS